jgi:hypothetical protein
MEEKIITESQGNRLWGRELDCTGSESCPMVGFCTGSVEYMGCVTKEFVSCLKRFWPAENE